MNIIEAYDLALQKRRWAKRGLVFGLSLIALLALFYAITIAAKGWHGDYLIGAVGFLLLSAQAYMRYREIRFWDREIKDFLGALSTNGGWCQP